MEAYMKGVPFLSKMVYKRGKGTVVKNLRFLSPTLGINGHLACVASISSRGITQNFEQESKKKMERGGEGRRGNACPQTPRFWKMPLDILQFCSFVN